MVPILVLASLIYVTLGLAQTIYGTALRPMRLVPLVTSLVMVMFLLEFPRVSTVLCM